ncbi:MAG TPA: EF-Tu/IF-2/RF-3 family GTPase, partial [Polyangiaceae bacterium]
LDAFCKLMPPPSPRRTVTGSVDPTTSGFSGFVFKVQANMDRAHRDRVAFLRICSGRFERGMKVKHVRTGREIRLANPTQFMAQERNIVEEAFAGDVIGLYDTGIFEIGDTLTDGADLSFEAIPSFAPEYFARLVSTDPLRRKQLHKGIEQLAQEGTIQLYRPPDARSGELILGAVGQLQLEVVKYRMSSEYDVDVRIESVPQRFARWVSRVDGAPVDLPTLSRAEIGLVAVDVRGRPVLLFEGDWALRTAERFHPELVFAETAVGVVVRDG